MPLLHHGEGRAGRDSNSHLLLRREVCRIPATPPARESIGVSPAGLEPAWTSLGRRRPSGWPTGSRRGGSRTRLPAVIYRLRAYKARAISGWSRRGFAGPTPRIRTGTVHIPNVAGFQVAPVSGADGGTCTRRSMVLDHARLLDCATSAEDWCSVEESSLYLLDVSEGSCRWTNGAGASGGTCTRRDLVLGQARLLDCATLAGKLEAGRPGQEVFRGRV